ncbi:MAG: type I glutamate--ammonia ligase [bacterium]
MFASTEEVSAFVRQNEIRFIDLKFINLIGGLHHITIPFQQFNQQLMESGVGFDASSTPGFKTVESGDMVLIPDLSTGFIDPFFQHHTLSFLCNIAEADTKKPFHRDPRYIATIAEEYLASTGIASESRWGPEFEYYIFDAVEFRNDSFYSYFKINSDEAQWSNYLDEGKQDGYQLFNHRGYHAAPPYDELHNIRSETVKVMEDCGIPVKYHHHEVGSSGQVEIEVVMGKLPRMADTVILGKYIIKMVAKKYGKTATFMPKPLYDEPGTGMHFHQHLFKNDKPLFFDKTGYGGLSQIAQSYVAGLLKHAPALTGLTNPSTNSYKRLIPGFEAPVALFFSLGNRSSAIRIPKYATEPETKRIEYRPPDATCNPHLAMSAMLLAGIDGIQQNLDLTKEGFGPFDVNLFDPENSHILKSIKSIPSSLDSALDYLRADTDFLKAGNVFNDDIIGAWIEYKYTKDYLQNRNRPTPYEYLLYYGV